MRLIDKDRLLKGSNHYWLEMENFGDIEAIDVRFIEMAEEIKAIPIEWIEEWGWKNGMSESMSLRVMIEDWEKETALDKQIEKWEIDDDVDWEMIQNGEITD